MTLDQAFARLRAASESVPQPLRLPTVAEVDAAASKSRSPEAPGRSGRAVPW
jgi:hypothetical protein